MMASWLKKRIELLSDANRRSSELLYLTVLWLFLMSMLCTKVAWIVTPNFSGLMLQASLSVYLLLFMGIYTAVVLIHAFGNRRLTVFAVLIAALFVVLCSRIQRNLFNIVVSAFLIATAGGKRFRRIVLVYMLSAAAVLTAASAGQLFGFTREITKVGAYGVGHAFGMIYPNDFGQMVFLVLLCIAYLYIRKKNALTLLLFWGSAVFILFIPKCRTIAVLSFLFPVGAVLMNYLTSHGKKVCKALRKALKVLMITAPFLCFAVTVLLGMQRKMLVNLTFGTYIENWSKRFIQSGIAFHEHGFPLLGENIRFNAGISEQLGAYNIPLYVMDNAYSTYAITRGMLWMTSALICLSVANRRSVKNRDYLLLLISVLISMFALMEREGLDFWYNFVFLYPLAATEIDDDMLPAEIQVHREGTELS